MTFDELRDETAARGFDYLTTDAAGIARLGRFINSARAELDRMYLWPWRETSTSGAAPLPVSDLGPVQSVLGASGNPLSRVDRQTLVQDHGDLSTAGSPSCYFVDWSSGTRTVTTYPASTATITVRHWKVTADLSADGDSPASPSEAHPLITDLAVRRAYRDSDNHESAEALQPEIDRQLDALLFQYAPGQMDGPDSYVGVTGASADW